MRDDRIRFKVCEQVIITRATGSDNEGTYHETTICIDSYWRLETTKQWVVKGDFPPPPLSDTREIAWMVAYRICFVTSSIFYIMIDKAAPPLPSYPSVKAIHFPLVGRANRTWPDITGTDSCTQKGSLRVWVYHSSRLCSQDARFEVLAVVEMTTCFSWRKTPCDS